MHSEKLWPGWPVLPWGSCSWADFEQPEGYSTCTLFLSLTELQGECQGTQALPGQMWAVKMLVEAQGLCGPRSVVLAPSLSGYQHTEGQGRLSLVWNGGGLWRGLQRK